MDGAPPEAINGSGKGMVGVNLRGTSNASLASVFGNWRRYRRNRCDGAAELQDAWLSGLKAAWRTLRIGRVAAATSRATHQGRFLAPYSASAGSGTECRATGARLRLARPPAAVARFGLRIRRRGQPIPGIGQANAVPPFHREPAKGFGFSSRRLGFVPSHAELLGDAEEHPPALRPAIGEVAEDAAEAPRSISCFSGTSSHAVMTPDLGVERGEDGM